MGVMGNWSGMSFWDWVKLPFALLWAAIKSSSTDKQLSAPQSGTQEEEKVGETMIKGIDVSKWQKGIDWKAAAADGNVFAFAKATDGANGVDPEFAHHKAGAKAAGLLFGAYHYFRFEQDIAQQVANFLRTAGDNKGELPPVVDVEWDRYSKHYCEGHEMDDEAADRVAVFLSILAHSIRGLPIIYTNAYFWSPGKRDSSFKDCPLWVPNYGAKNISQVKIPKPWSKAHFWQYKGDKPGYGVDKMDFNYFLGGRKELNKLVRA